MITKKLDGGFAYLAIEPASPFASLPTDGATSQQTAGRSRYRR
jgi:hypothetical protein